MYALQKDKMELTDHSVEHWHLKGLVVFGSHPLAGTENCVGGAISQRSHYGASGDKRLLTT